MSFSLKFLLDLTNARSNDVTKSSYQVGLFMNFFVQTSERFCGDGRACNRCCGPGKGQVHPDERSRRLPTRILRQAASMLWLWDRMVFVSISCSLSLLQLHISTFNSFLFCNRFLLGFAFPLLWYYATMLYFGNHYRRDPRERAGLAASAIAVTIFSSC